MKLTQKKVAFALALTLEHHDDIRVEGGYRNRYGREFPLAVVGDKTALEEFELYLAASFSVKHIEDETSAYALTKAILDLRELRQEESVDLDETVFLYPHLEIEFS